MATADIFSTGDSDTDGNDVAAPSDGLLTDLYQHASVSRLHESSDNQQREMLASSTMDTHDILDSAPPLPPAPSPTPPPRRSRNRSIILVLVLV
jgi:hypothetical protein